MQNSKRQQINIYSHGFGVRQDGCGIFTALAAALPDLLHVMFDYNVIVPNQPDIVIPLPQQAELLRHKVAAVRAVYPEADINLVGHSQGCVAIALANPDNIKRAIFIAPTIVLDPERTIKRVGSRTGSEINVDGVSRVVRSDGSINLIPAAFWACQRIVQPLQACAELAAQTSTVALLADQDAVLAPPDLVRTVPQLTVKLLAGDHDFTGESRQRMISEVVKVLHEN